MAKDKNPPKPAPKPTPKEVQKAADRAGVPTKPLGKRSRSW